MSRNGERRCWPLRVPGAKAVTVVLAFVLSLVASDKPSEGCSSIVLDDSASVFATNYDNSNDMCLLFVNTRGQAKSGISASTEGHTLHWVSRYASITFNVSGYQLPWAGMNERGLMLSTMALNQTAVPEPDERLPLDFGPLWMQYVLDTCATVEDVIASDQRVRIVSTVDHYLVADRNGGAAVIEFLNGEMVVHTKTDLPIKALTNDPYDESIDVWLQYLDAGTGDCSDVQPRHERFCQLAEHYSSFQPSDNEGAVASAFNALESVADSSTKMSIVFDTRNFRVHFRRKNNPEVRYLDLDDFDWACPAQVQMAELHSLPPGRISSEFIDLSLPMCLEHLLSYIEYESPEVPQEAVEEFFAIVAGFTCPAPRLPSRRFGNE